jgi:large subunit ribosomal protein L23
MFEIIRRPVFTEKTTYLLDKYNQYVFEVDSRWTKKQVRALMEKMFSIQVISINSIILPRRKRRGANSTERCKRVFVTLDKKENLVFFLKNFYEFVPISSYSSNDTICCF